MPGFFGKGNPEATTKGLVLWTIGGAVGGWLWFWFWTPVEHPMLMRSPWFFLVGAIVGGGLAYWQLDE